MLTAHLADGWTSSLHRGLGRCNAVKDVFISHQHPSVNALRRDSPPCHLIHQRAGHRQPLIASSVVATLGVDGLAQEVCGGSRECECFLGVLGYTPARRAVSGANRDGIARALHSKTAEDVVAEGTDSL